MDFKNFSLLIFCDSSKILLEVGGKKLPENILQQAKEKNFAQIFLCVDRETLPIQILSWKFEAKILITKNLSKSLAKIKTDWALAISADMPFFDFEIFQEINFKRLRAILPVVGGEIKTSAGFFHKSLAEKISAEKNLLEEIKKIPHKFIEVAADEKIFFQVKNRADLRLAQGRAANLSRKVPVISIAVLEETDFTQKLVESLSAEKISVGIVKSEVDDFNFELEDVKKFQGAGAKNVAVVSPEGWLIFRQTERREDFLTIAEKFEGADLILIESRTPATQPALSLLQVDDIKADKKIAATFSSSPASSDEVFQFDINDIESAVKICKFLVE